MDGSKALRALQTANTEITRLEAEAGALARLFHAFALLEVGERVEVSFWPSKQGMVRLRVVHHTGLVDRIHDVWVDPDNPTTETGEPGAKVRNALTHLRLGEP